MVMKKLFTALITHKAIAKPSISLSKAERIRLSQTNKLHFICLLLLLALSVSHAPAVAALLLNHIEPFNVMFVTIGLTSNWRMRRDYPQSLQEPYRNRNTPLSCTTCVNSCDNNIFQQLPFSNSDLLSDSINSTLSDDASSSTTTPT